MTGRSPLGPDRARQATHTTRADVVYVTAHAVTYTTSVMQVLLGDPVNKSTVTMAETIA